MFDLETVDAIKELLPILSLLVAFLAVIASPYVSYRVVSRQIKSSGETTEQYANTAIQIVNRNIIAPLRQEWINKLRSTLAEFFAKAEAYKIKGSSKNTESDFHELLVLVNFIELMLNPDEDDHISLLNYLRSIQGLLNSSIESQLDVYWGAIKDGRAQAKRVLGKEWSKVKNEI